MLLDVKRTEKWIAALEANGHRQIRFDVRVGNHRCALGIINESEGDLIPMDRNWLPMDFLRLGMSRELGMMIADLNDGTTFYGMYPTGSWNHTLRPHTFAEIANLLKIRLRTQQEFIGVIQAQGGTTCFY